MPLNVPQRLYWNGAPERLSDAFRLTKPKGNHALPAACEVWSHQLGWELKLMIDGHGLQMSAVVRSASEMQAKADEWQREMLAIGWQEAI